MAKRIARRRKSGDMAELHSEYDTRSGKFLAGLLENPLPSRGRQLDADELIATAAALAKAGYYLENGDSDDDMHWLSLKDEYRKYAIAFTSYLQDGCSLPLVSSIRENHRLNGEELEILCVCAASAIGSMDSLHDIEDLQRYFPASRRSRMKTARMLLPEGRLIMSGLIQLDEETPFRDSRIDVDPHFVEAVLRGKEQISSAWNCSTEEELLKKLPLLRRMVHQSAGELEDDSAYAFSPIRKGKRELDRFIKIFLSCVKPEWKLAELFTRDMAMEEAIILVALLDESVSGRPRPTRPWRDDNEWCGENLAKAAADKMDEVNEIVRNHLSSSSRLVAGKLIEPILAGTGEILEDDEDSVKNLAFRLTDSCLAKIGVKRKRGKGHGGRNPLLKMEQLELSPEIREALELAVNQYACRDVLDSWELEKAIPYGRAVTMMFYGPPGVGKTAAAEAVASMLKKRILVADYSQIQNCWVGETEKNIVKLFEKARDGDCVLFWDEADAMFYDRETASHNWEVRDVNVLLQELEKFDGVCILSTNRKVELDKALARRISLKIEFKPPTREQARAIWRKLLPAKLPLAENVDFDALCTAGLTGGEIKNVILNAARRAASRGRDTKLDMADFNWALDVELSGMDMQRHGGRKLGF